MSKSNRAAPDGHERELERVISVLKKCQSEQASCALILLSNCEAEMKEVCGEEHERHQPVIAKFN